MILYPAFVLPLIFRFAKLDGWCVACRAAPFVSGMNYRMISLAADLQRILPKDWREKCRRCYGNLSGTRHQRMIRDYYYLVGDVAVEPEVGPKTTINRIIETKRE